METRATSPGPSPEGRAGEALWRCFKNALAEAGRHGGRFELSDPATGLHYAGKFTSTPKRDFVRLQFDDLSEMGLWAKSEASALDSGPALLGPISEQELRGLEALLAQLWIAIDSNVMSDAQAAQLQAMAQLLEQQRREAEPEVTERWKIVGAVWTVLRYVIKEVPKDALAWWKLAEILSGIDWHGLSKSLPY